MRALILLLSATVVALAVPVLLHAGGGARPNLAGPRFQVGALISDAQDGEEAVYRDQDGNRLVYRVVQRLPAGLSGYQRLRISRRLEDRTGRLMDPRFGELAYEHDPFLHGPFPLMAPQEPEGLDRTWIWARIRQEPRLLAGQERLCWRVDALDPALPAGSDEVQAWFHPEVPVFGLVAWVRDGRTWTLVSARRAGSGT